MCGSESGMVWGGLVVAAAMLVWAFASNGEAGAHQHHAPVAHEAPVQRVDRTTLTVSSDGVALRFDSGLTVRLAL